MTTPDLDPDLDTAAAAEFAVLRGEPGRALLELVAAVAQPGPADLARWRKSADADLVAAAARIVTARRKGRAKFARADRMWFTAKGLEQATAEAVARHKAARFAPAGPGGTVVDLCSGVGGDALAIAALAPVVAVDLDPAMAARTRWNADAYDVGDRVRAVAARAEGFAIPPDARVHVDPDRRATSARKANAVAEYAPGLDFLRALARAARGGAIKLGPASDFAAHFGGGGFEVEVTSLGGECKEATAWFGDLAGPGVRRRATALPAGATWTDRDDPDPAAGPVAAGPLDAWVHDPDPALARAGLVDGFARAQGWHRIEAGVDLFTGPSPSASPLASSFAVAAEFPLDARTLRREVAARGLGPLEIKTRGLATSPEAYRAQLHPAGPHPATWILIAGRAGPGRAILARRP